LVQEYEGGDEITLQEGNSSTEELFLKKVAYMLARAKNDQAKI
jgi:hypothetical protein